MSKFMIEIYEPIMAKYGENNLRFARVSTDGAAQAANDDATNIYEVLHWDFHPRFFPEYLERFAEDEEDLPCESDPVTSRTVMKDLVKNQTYRLTAVFVPEDALYLCGEPGKYTQFAFEINPFDWDLYEAGEVEGVKVLPSADPNLPVQIDGGLTGKTHDERARRHVEWPCATVEPVPFMLECLDHNTFVPSETVIEEAVTAIQLYEIGYLDSVPFREIARKYKVHFSKVRSLLRKALNVEILS